MGRPRRTSPAPTPIPASTAVDFRALVESLCDVLYVLDLEGRFAYLNPRAYEVFGYDRDDDRFIGRPFQDILAPGASAAAVEAVRHRVRFPLDRHVFRIDGRHRDGHVIPLEVHAGPVVADGRVVARVGVCRVLDALDRHDGAVARALPTDALHADRMRIARGLRDAIAQVVFGVTADRDASEAFLLDVKRATAADMARRLRLDEVDLAILRLIATGGSNREIGATVHLSAAAVKDHIRRMMDRFGSRRRAELAAHALRLGIV